MTFEFQKPEEGELSLQDAVGQALGAASKCWELVNFAGEFDSSQASEIADALIAEVIRKQKVINDRHEVEVALWKKRLVDETATLRGNLEDRRNRLRNLYSKFWPLAPHQSSDLVLMVSLERVISDLFERLAVAESKTASTYPHKPE